MEELRKLAQFLADMRLEDAGVEVLESAKACVLDTVALALGARENPMFQGIKDVYRKWDGPQAEGIAPVSYTHLSATPSASPGPSG